jgi:hypothetical protein
VNHGSRQSSNQQGVSSQEVRARAAAQEVPLWAKPIVNICDRIYPFMLVFGALLLVLLLSLVGVGRTEFEWVPRVVSAMSFFLTLGFISWIIARHETLVPGWVGLVLSAVFYYGLPLLVIFLATRTGEIKEVQLSLSAAAEAATGASLVIRSTVTAFTNMAFFLALTAIVRLVIGFSTGFVSSSTTARTVKMRYIDTSNKDTLKPSLIPKCWQMSRCRPGVRMTCPNYLDRIPCWKRRSGCFCDRELANYLMNSVDRKDAGEVIDMQTVTAQSGANAIRGYMGAANKRPWKLQKSLCFNCPLYLEHQEYKYRNLSWISIPATAAIVALSWPVYDAGYQWLSRYLDDLMVQLTQIKDVARIIGPDEGATLANSSFEYVLLAVLTLILFGYVISMTETFFLKWKM